MAIAARPDLEAGYVALGAPVRRHAGSVVAAISLGGPSTRFTDARIPGLLRSVRASAARISQRLGWAPTSASRQVEGSAS